jgi:hypothetical protein
MVGGTGVESRLGHLGASLRSQAKAGFSRPFRTVSFFATLPRTSYGATFSCPANAGSPPLGRDVGARAQPGLDFAFAQVVAKAWPSKADTPTDGPA